MKFSVNPYTNKSYRLPKDLDDSKSINSFLNRNKKKKIVVIQGLGFVGSAMSLVCSNSINQDYAVIGVDLPNVDSYWKIKSLNSGFFPIISDDKKVEQLYRKSLKKGNLLATYDPTSFQFADIIIVDINLDVKKSSFSKGALNRFDVKLNNFKKAIKTIGSNCKENILIIVETTVPPGTCEKIVKPIIEKELVKRKLRVDLYMIGHSYERVMPGPKYIDSIRSFPRVYSGINEKSSKATYEFLANIIDTTKNELTKLEHTNASEISKVLENSYRAMNISFMVEWSRFAEEAGVNIYDIINAIKKRPTHSNIMYPGIGVGGYCLPKDPLLASWSRKKLFKSNSNLEMSINSVSVNDQMPFFAFKRLEEVFGKIKNKKILFLGVSYLGGIGDTRFTPVAIFYDNLKKLNKNILVHDPLVKYWKEKNFFIENDLSKALRFKPEIIIFSTTHKLYKKNDTIDKIMKIKSLKIFDSLGILNKKQIKRLRYKHSVSVIGSS